MRNKDTPEDVESDALAHADQTVQTSAVHV